MKRRPTDPDIKPSNPYAEESVSQAKFTPYPYEWKEAQVFHQGPTITECEVLCEWTNSEIKWIPKLLAGHVVSRNPENHDSVAFFKEYSAVEVDVS